MRNCERIAERIEREGYALGPGFLTADELRRAREEVAQYFPRAEELARDPGRREGLRLSGGFPFAGELLNRIATHPGMIDLAEVLFGTDDVRLGYAILQAKYGPDLVEGRDQRLHNDAWGRNSLVPPRTDGPYRRLIAIVYLSDVDTTTGPTYVVPSRHARGTPLVTDDGQAVYEPDAFPELYAHEEPVVTPAGSALVFTGHTVHRGAAVTAPAGERFALFLSFHSGATPWLEDQSWSGSAASPLGPRVRRVVESATPRQLAVLGVPRPGDAYWNDTTLAGMAELYPGLELAPYRAAVAA